MATQTKGFCKYCGKAYTKSGMLRHLASCKERKIRLDEENGKQDCGYFQIVISGKYTNVYWLIIEVSENTTLKELDKFIRDIWVECCGHLSAFDVNGARYEICPNTDRFWGTPAKSMNYRLKDVIKAGDVMDYEYDFGSTTELLVKVYDYRVGKSRKDKIVILSRNNPLEIVCSQCEKNKASWVDPMSYYKGNPFWCDECLHRDDYDENEHDYDEYEIPEYMLPICNSPRMGTCGYEGSNIYPDQFEPDKNEGRSRRNEFSIESM